MRLPVGLVAVTLLFAAQPPSARLGHHQCPGLYRRFRAAMGRGLSQDIFKVPATNLPQTVRVLTVTGGRVVHSVPFK